MIRQKEIDNNTVIEDIDYDVTELRQDPDYIYYYVHWTRFWLLHYSCIYYLLDYLGSSSLA